MVGITQNNHIFTHKSLIPIELKKIELFGKRIYITPDGNKYPSVTTVLSEYGTNKEAIKRWALSIGQEKVNQIKKQATERGILTHSLIEQYLKNKIIPVENYNNNQLSLFRQMRFKLHAINNIALQESHLYSDELKLAGQVDCVAEYNGVLSIIDFKTSTNIKTEQMIENYFIQCTAYGLMLLELYGLEVENNVVIIGNEKGISPSVFVRPFKKYIPSLIKALVSYNSSV